MCQACNPGAAAYLHEANRRDFLKGSAASIYALMASSAAAKPASAAAELIFFNGPIHTMARAHDRAEAVAVRGGRIAAVGARDEVLAGKGPDTRMIDLDGHALSPGFVDPHMHTSLTIMDSWLDLGPFTNGSIADALGKLGAAVKQSRPGEWIRGQQLDPSLMPGAPVTRLGLDSIAPDNPVFILESNGHVAYANSKAFAAVGITRDTADPPHGRFLRDAAGDLSGRIEEGAAYQAFFAKMPMPSPDEMRQNVRRLFDCAASVGCTALHDCGVGSPAFLSMLTDIAANDAPIRLGGFVTGSNKDFWSVPGLAPGAGSDRFRVTGFKFWADGSNQARTGYQREPYRNSASRGDLNYSVEQLAADIGRAHDRGWQVAVHANGDAAIDVTLDAYGTVLGKTPRADHRHRIEHCSLLHAEQMDRMAALGVSPSFLIGHVHYWGLAFRDRILGPERAALYDPCASALRKGLRVSLHSDYNVTPIDPLRCIDNAVNRVMRDGGEVLNPAERISAAQALRAMTIDAAWQCRMDHIAGSIEAGKYADFVVLDRDPLAVEPAAIRSIKVVETWMEGKRRFAA